MYAFSRPINQGSNNSTEIVIIVLFMCFVSLIISTGVGIYFYTREETNCNKIEDSYNCKRNEKCKWNDDDSECEYDTDSDTDSDTDTDTDDSDTGVPYQISLSTDDNYCSDWGAIHQQVPGCGRICSSEDKRGIKTTDSSNWVVWGSEAGISSDCITASKIDKIWEVQSGSSNRKLADGYTLSNYPAGTSVKCGKNDLRSDNNSVYRVSENGKLRHYPSDTIADSWDSKWREQTKTIGDCEGLTLGDDLESKSVDDGSGSGSGSGSSPDSYFDKDAYYSIKSRDTYYCSNTTDSGIICDKTAVSGDGEKFQFEYKSGNKDDGGSYGIKSKRTGKYCKDMQSDDENVKCESNSSDLTGAFKIKKHNTGYSIKGYDDKYCVAVQNGGSGLRCISVQGNHITQGLKITNISE